MTLQITWSLVEVDRCYSCHETRVLWTHSHAKKFKSISMPLLACAPCFRSRAESKLTWIDSDSGMYDYRTGKNFEKAVYDLVVNTAPIEIDESQYPYLATLFKCDACENYIAEGKEVLGFRQDNLAPLRLHYHCSTEASCCGRTYASRYAVESGMYATLTQINGDIKCQICLDEYLEENNETLDNDYFYCNYCDNYKYLSEETEWDDEAYCQNCYDNNVYTCSDCREQIWDGDDHDCSESYGGLIHDYGYKPQPYFFGKNNKERIFMGFELEVEIRDGDMREHAERVTNSLGEHVYLKYDGSLEHGFEIVTHPHTLDSYRKEFAFESFRRFRGEGLRSWDTDTCGLHIHVSRTAFGDSPYDNRTRSDIIKSRQFHELRFIKLIYDNERQVTRLAGRTSPVYANFQDKGSLAKKVIGNRKKDSTGFDGMLGDVGGRHAAVNTYNDSTLEVRIFKGSLNEKRVLMALEFVHSAVEYTRDLKVNGKNKALSWLAFSGYVHANQEQYPHLHELMVHTLERDRPTIENE